MSDGDAHDRRALLGLGNVGGGVVKLLEDNAAAIEARLGARIEVRAIAVRDPDKANRVVDGRPRAAHDRRRPRRSRAPTSTSCAS